MAYGPLGFATGLDFRRESIDGAPMPMWRQAVLGRGFTSTTGSHQCHSCVRGTERTNLQGRGGAVGRCSPRQSTPTLAVRVHPGGVEVVADEHFWCVGRSAPDSVRLRCRRRRKRMRFRSLLADPLFGRNFNIGSLSQSIPALQPEKSKNYSGGFVGPEKDFQHGR